MKKYKLKKDFPGSKIGDVWVKPDNGFMSPDGRETIKMHEHLFKPFNDWFEDYEEPKGFWMINILGIVEYVHDLTEVEVKMMEEIGNHFETKEEAEKAVKKLKALTRMKDKGFRFVRRSIRDLTITYSFDNYDEPDIPQMNKDLDLLFSGEDD